MPRDIKLKNTIGEGEALPQAGAMASITMATSSPAPKELGRAYGFRWTLFGYDKYLEKLRQEAQSARYAVWGYETCPDTGRPHLQGYIHYENKRSLGKFSTTFNNCWVGKCDGTANDNRKYCLKIRDEDKKPNEKYEEFGTMPVQGHRTDWAKALEDLKTKEVIDVIESQPQLAPCQRALREIKSMYLKPLHRDVTVFVLYGDAGTGKTRWAYERDSNLYKKPVGDWWDGYTGQKTILLDDFYGWIKYHDILHILDRYPLNCQVKGGFVWAQWDTVIITSNDHPARWYKDKGLTPALRRRFKKLIRVTSIDGEASYQEEALHETPQEDDEA